MAFDVREYREFVELLYKHPEWRAELRHLVLTEDILTLPQVMRELSVSVRELAESQKRTDEVMRSLGQRVDELAEAQKRTEQRIDELAYEIKETRREVGRLTSIIGSSLEDEVGSVAETVFERNGYRVLQEASSLRFDGDVDLAFPVEDSQGRRLWVLLECKAHLGRNDVRAWANRVRSEGYRQALKEAGIEPPYLVYMYAIRVDLAAREALQRTGLGLMKGDGEVFGPQAEMA